MLWKPKFTHIISVPIDKELVRAQCDHGYACHTQPLLVLPGFADRFVTCSHGSLSDGQRTRVLESWPHETSCRGSLEKAEHTLIPWPEVEVKVPSTEV